MVSWNMLYKGENGTRQGVLRNTVFAYRLDTFRYRLHAVVGGFFERESLLTHFDRNMRMISNYDQTKG